jgi:hypothetical protein
VGSSIARDRPDAGADTVIGFVLVTGISILMISVVMLVGAPALEQVQSRQQVDSMVGSYQRLDRSVSTLLSGAPAGTTPSWQVSMADGSLTLDEGGTQIWGFAANRWQENQEYEFWFGEYDDGDSQVKILNAGPATNGDLRVEITRWENDDDKTTDTETIAGGLGNGGEHDVNALTWDMAGQSTQIKLKDLGNEDGNRTVAHAWFVDAGAVEWSLSRGGEMKRLFYQNTGILADLDEGQVMHNPPRLRAPDDDVAGEESVFVRIVNLDGALSVGGRSTTDVLLSSEGNHARLSSGNATQAQIYPPTETLTAWKRHLATADDGLGYSWEDGKSVFTSSEAAAYYDAPASSDEIAVTLVETTVEMARSGGT